MTERWWQLESEIGHGHWNLLGQHVPGLGLGALKKLVVVGLMAFKRDEGPQDVKICSNQLLVHAGVHELAEGHSLQYLAQCHDLSLDL